MYEAYRKNYDLVTEFGFYERLPPKMQNDLIDLLFGKFLALFTATF